MVFSLVRITVDLEQGIEFPQLERFAGDECDDKAVLDWTKQYTDWIAEMLVRYWGFPSVTNVTTEAVASSCFVVIATTSGKQVLNNRVIRLAMVMIKKDLEKFEKLLDI